MVAPRCDWARGKITDLFIFMYGIVSYKQELTSTSRSFRMGAIGKAKIMVSQPLVRDATVILDDSLEPPNSYPNQYVCHCPKCLINVLRNALRR